MQETQEVRVQFLDQDHTHTGHQVMCWKIGYKMVNFYSLTSCCGMVTFSRSWAWRDLRRFCRSVLLKLYLVPESLGIQLKYSCWYSWTEVWLRTRISNKLPNDTNILVFGDLTFSSKDLEPYWWNPLNEQMERGGKDGTDQKWREDKHGFW